MQFTEVNSEIEALWVEIEALRTKNKDLQEQINRLRNSVPSPRPWEPIGPKPPYPETTPWTPNPWGPVIWCSNPDEQTTVYFNGKL